MKKLSLYICFIFLVSILSACSSSESESPIDLGIIVNKFKEAGLEIETPTESITEEHALGSLGFIEGQRILVPALGEGEGGYLFLFDTQSNLEKLKDVYEESEESSSMFNSHMYVKDNVLLQMSNKMSQTEFDKYVKVLEKL